MKINFTSKAIEISQTFANKASHFGSMEYQELRTVIHDLPNFEVVVKSTPKRRRSYMTGLTYEYMEYFISMHDEDGSIMQDFQCLRQGCSYAEIKRWFLLSSLKSITSLHKKNEYHKNDWFSKRTDII